MPYCDFETTKPKFAPQRNKQPPWPITEIGVMNIRTRRTFIFTFFGWTVEQVNSVEQLHNILRAKGLEWTNYVRLFVREADQRYASGEKDEQVRLGTKR